MFLYTFRKKLGRKLRTEINFHKEIKKRSFSQPVAKIAFADISNIAINRYLYNFLKFFEINGYTVYLPNDRKIIKVLCKKHGEFQYASWLLKENFIRFGKPSRKDTKVWMDSAQLSNDYFTSLLNDTASPHHYHIPMSEFPYFYHSNNWGIKMSQNGIRKRSILMLGNCDKKFYHGISKSPFFNLESRYETAFFLSRLKNYFGPESEESLQKFLVGDRDFKVVVVDTSKQFQIEGLKMKEILHQFLFFLALPGVLIPQCHNLVEAMAAGSIPLIHESYANLMRPKLRNGIDCFTYRNLEDLNETIEALFETTGPDMKNMQLAVLEYYDRYLHPASVIERIENNHFEKIFIQAEYISLNYLNKNFLF